MTGSNLYVSYFLNFFFEGKGLMGQGKFLRRNQVGRINHFKLPNFLKGLEHGLISS